jgi:hypothetical protein
MLKLLHDYQGWVCIYIYIYIYIYVKQHRELKLHIPRENENYIFKPIMTLKGLFLARDGFIFPCRNPVLYFMMLSPILGKQVMRSQLEKTADLVSACRACVLCLFALG